MYYEPMVMCSCLLWLILLVNVEGSHSQRLSSCAVELEHSVSAVPGELPTIEIVCPDIAENGELGKLFSFHLKCDIWTISSSAFTPP